MEPGLCGSARVLLLFLTALLAACAAAPAPTAIPAAPTSRPTIAATPRATRPPAATAAPQPTVPPGALIMWASAEGPRLEALQSLVAEASGVAGAEVRVVGKSADGLHADVSAAVLAGLPLPDLLWCTQDDLGILRRQEILRPAGDGLDAGQFIPAAVAGALLDGQRWGTPLAAEGSLFLLYNKQLVDRPPRTSDELILAARRQVVGDRYGLVAGWAEPRWFVAWLAGMGGAALDSSGAPALDTPQTSAALNLLKELRAAGPPPPSTYAEGAQLFRQGRAAFAIDGDWSLESYRQYTETLDLGIASMPLIPATGRAAASPLGGIYLLYGKTLDGARLAQANALGAALAQPAAQARIARDLKLLPALRAALAGPDVRGDQGLAAAAALAEAAPGLPPTRELRCAWGALGAELPPVLLGELAAEDAGRLMQASATNCLAAAP